ncbi:MAG TPA: DUF4142 domain-containing protein [Caulobacteraceae bacterium]|jgi:putative membrane protein
MKKLLFCAAGAALLSACASDYGPPPPPMAGPPPPPMGGDRMPMPPMPTDAPGYVAMAGASDMFEIQSGQLALQRSRDPQVRAFAQMLVADHNMTTSEVMRAASAARVPAGPPMLTPEQQTMLDRMQRASPAEFDLVFARNQVHAHRMALALHQTYAARGDAPPLRAVAARAVPVVQGHLQQARGLRGAERAGG